MPSRTPEVRTTDSKARLTLPKSFANSTLLVEVKSDVEIVIRKAAVIPLSPDGKLLPDSSPGPLSPRDWKIFLDALDNPPVLSPKFKAAIARARKRRLSRKSDNRAS